MIAVASEKLSPRTINETGNWYGRLTVLDLAGHGKHNKIQWLCRCICGNEKVIVGGSLRSGKTKSYGCINRIDETGNRYGILAVIKVAEARNHQTLWHCRCDCGSKRIISGDDLRRKDGAKVKSCGCLQKLPRGEAAFNRIYKEVMRGAKDRNYRFDLNKEQVRNLVTQNCFYCGRVPAQRQRGHNGDFIYNGIDRVWNELGYVEDNVVSCCKICNWAKRTRSIDEFKAWATRLYEHFVKGQVE